MKTRLFVLALAASILCGCVSVEKVATGERKVGERMTLLIEGPWNHVNAPNIGPAQVWTMEGLPVDQMLLYSGIGNGEMVHAESAMDRQANKKSFFFRAAMQSEEIVSMFEGMLTRDGSRFTLTKLEPVTFGGVKGFRFAYQLVRKSSNVHLSGVGYGAVSKGQLFSILYMAPRLAFFDRHIQSVEKIVSGVRIAE